MQMPKKCPKCYQYMMSPDACGSCGWKRGDKIEPCADCGQPEEEHDLGGIGHRYRTPTAKSAQHFRDRDSGLETADSWTTESGEELRIILRGDLYLLEQCTDSDSYIWQILGSVPAQVVKRLVKVGKLG